MTAELIKNVLVLLAIGALSGMGVGGGGLLVIYLVFATDAEQIAAQGANLIFFLASAAASSAVSAAKGKINLRLTLTMSSAGALTGVLGALLAKSCAPAILRRVFGIMLTAGAAASLLSTLGKIPALAPISRRFINMKNILKENFKKLFTK